MIFLNCPGQFYMSKRPNLSHKKNVFIMRSLHPSIIKYVIRTDIKVNKSIHKIYCRPRIEELGEEEGQKTWFLNKKDRIIFI